MGIEKFAASAGVWAWENFGEDFINWSSTLLKRAYKDTKEQNKVLQNWGNRWANFNWGPASKRYKKHMQTIYGYIRVIGTTEPIPIGEIFSDVYILEKPLAYRRFDITQLKNLQEEPNKLDDEKRTRGLKVVVSKSGHRLYILGKPGAGKTTFLKYLVHQTIIADELNKLPIFVTLRDWDVLNNKLIDFIAQQFEICEFPDAVPFIEYLLENGRAIVLFDGLDEVPKENNQRNNTIQALHNFSKKYLEAQIVITCRVAANDYSFTEFTYTEMADFNTAQVETYTRNWFGKSSKIAENFIKELNLEENKGVRDLGRSPLLLSMICLAYDETLSIPKRRVELYEEALEALLKKWDSNRRIKRDQIYKQLSLGYKRQMFARVAAEYFDKGEIFFSKKSVADKIEKYLYNLPPNNTSDIPDGEAILETISAQHGILVERAKGIYSFSHLTFQEYYTAKYIAENTNNGTLERLSSHITDSRWREVFLLTASLLYDATPLLQEMQKAAQNVLTNSTSCLAIQTWTINRAINSLSSNEVIVRSIYWFLSLALSRALARPAVLSGTRSLVHARALTSTLDQVLACNLSHNLDQALDNMHYHDKDLDLDEDLEIAINLAQELTYLFEQISTLQNHVSLKYLLFDVNTMNLIIAVNFFIFLTPKERSNRRVEKLQKFLNAWKWSTENPIGIHIEINCPSSQASDQEWKIFRSLIIKTTIDIFEINLSTTWISDEYKTAIAYLKANQLFSDCLRIANVENRDAIKNMILTPPKG